MGLGSAGAVAVVVAGFHYGDGRQGLLGTLFLVGLAGLGGLAMGFYAGMLVSFLVRPPGVKGEEG